MGHRSTRDYAKTTKLGVAVGIGLFLFGELGQYGAPRIQGTVPEWELSLFVLCTIAGILIVMTSIFLFGIALPLIE